MTPPEVDQELERLFSVTRAATAPDAEARERIRAGVSATLATGGSARSSLGKRAWLGLAVVLLGAGGAALLRPAAPSVPAAPPVSAAPTPAASPASVAAPRAVALESPEAAPSVAPPSTAPRTAPKPRASSASTDDTAEELPLVRSMQQALRAGNAPGALALADEHSRRFPRGTLVEEREGVRAVAQCQTAAASARAGISEAFLRRFAASPYAARVKAACQ